MKCHPVNGFLNYRCELNVTSYTNHYSCLNITNTLQISLSDSPLLPDFKLLLFCFPSPVDAGSSQVSLNDSRARPIPTMSRPTTPAHPNSTVAASLTATTLATTSFTTALATALTISTLATTTPPQRLTASESQIGQNSRCT